MASIGHVALGMAAGRLYGGRRWPAMLSFGALSMLPDADVIAFQLGIPYAAPWGHRGATHSLAIALGIALLATLGALLLRRPALRLGGFVLAVVASHGLLDALTTGGLGAALFWPFSNARIFLPWRPIPVAPIGTGMLSARGLHVAAVELLFFAPFFVAAIWPARVERD